MVEDLIFGVYAVGIILTNTENNILIDSEILHDGKIQGTC